MADYSRDDFDIPVEDYDFSAASDVGALIDQMGRAGGFTATKLAHARDILREAIDISAYPWRERAANLPEAMLAIFCDSGKPVEDAAPSPSSTCWPPSIASLNTDSRKDC